MTDDDTNYFDRWCALFCNFADTHFYVEGMMGSSSKVGGLGGCYMYSRKSLGTYPRSRDTVFHHTE
jgi:hypothetical protein